MLRDRKQLILIGGVLLIISLLLYLFLFRLQASAQQQTTQSPWLGIDVKVQEVKGGRGVLVASVFKGSPAQKAGIEKGDLIITIDDLSINNVKTLKDYITQCEISDVLRIGILRDGYGRTFFVKLTERPSNYYDLLAKTVDSSKTAWGIIVTSLSKELRLTYRIPSTLKGVVVVVVFSASQAQKLGVLPGDLITSVNREATPTISDFYSAISENGVNQVVIWRNGKTYSFLFKVDPNNPPLASMGTVVADTIPMIPLARRVAISANEASEESPVAFRFATSPYFIVYDTRSDKSKILSNPMLDDDSKTLGGQVAQFLLNNGVSAVITGRIGATAFQYFQSMNIPVYIGQLGIVEEVYQVYKGGGLQPATEEDVLIKRTSSSVQRVAGSSSSNRSTLCLCPVCNIFLSHPPGSSCADLVCPKCGTRLTRADEAITNLNQPEIITPSTDTTPGAQTTAGDLPVSTEDQKSSLTIIGGTNTIYNAPMDSSALQQVAETTNTTTGEPTPNRPAPDPDETTAGSSSGAQTTENATQEPNSTNSGPATGEGDGYPPNRPYTVPAAATTSTTTTTTTTTTDPLATKIQDPQDLSYSDSKDKDKIGKVSTDADSATNFVALEVTDKDKDKTVVNTYAVALTTPSTDGSVAPNFSTAPYFLIIPPTGQTEIVANPNISDEVDVDRQTVQFVIDEGATIAVAGSFTELALEALEMLRAQSIDGITGVAKQLFYSESSTGDTTHESPTASGRPGIGTTSTSTSSTTTTTSSDSEEEGGPPENRGGGKAKGKGEEDDETI